jgi:hypothetical protein
MITSVKNEIEEKVRVTIAGAEDLTTEERADLFSRFFTMSAIPFAKFLYGAKTPTSLISALISAKLDMPSEAESQRDQLQAAADSLITLARIPRSVLELLAKQIAGGKSIEVQEAAQRSVEAIVVLAENLKISSDVVAA